MDKYFYDLAKQAAAIANEGFGDIIKPEWIYCQWCHETGGFDSKLAIEYHNLGGLTQVTPNDTPQPDGDYYYKQFDSYEAYAEYFGKYLRYYEEDGLYDATCIDDYIVALKHGGYFGDTLENYLSSVKGIYAANFNLENNDKEVKSAPAEIVLIRADEPGVYALPDELTFDDVETILVNGEPVKEGRYAIVADNTAVDIFDAKDTSVVTVVLK
jgi:hypothetical protein